MATETKRTFDASRYSAADGINSQTGHEWHSSEVGSTPAAMYVGASGIRPVIKTVSGFTDGSAIARPKIRVGTATVVWVGTLPVATATFHYTFEPPIFGETGLSVVAELSTGTGRITALGWAEIIL